MSSPSAMHSGGGPRPNELYNSTSIFCLQPIGQVQDSRTTSAYGDGWNSLHLQAGGQGSSGGLLHAGGLLPHVPFVAALLYII